MTLTGTLQRRFFGGFVWILEPDGAAPVQLEGDVPAELKGRQVVVKGRPLKGAMGLAMAGQIWEVRSIRAR